MARTTVEVDVVSCDSCGATAYVEGDNVPEGWYIGGVDNGSTGGEWFACKPAHIKKAVMVATGEEVGEG